MQHRRRSSMQRPQLVLLLSLLLLLLAVQHSWRGAGAEPEVEGEEPATRMEATLEQQAQVVAFQLWRCGAEPEILASQLEEGPGTESTAADQKETVALPEDTPELVRDAADAVGSATAAAAQPHSRPRRRKRLRSHVHPDTHPGGSSFGAEADATADAAADAATDPTLDALTDPAAVVETASDAAAEAAEASASIASETDTPDVEPEAAPEELTAAEREQAARVLAEEPGPPLPRKHVPVDPTTLPDPGYFALCLATRDQHADIREWIEHHRGLGVGKFYVYDHNSTVPMNDTIMDYIRSGLVTYRYFRTRPELTSKNLYPQMAVYSKCLWKFGKRHTWMGFIDTDEFLILKDGTPHMPALLAEYEEYAGLGVHWVMFGSSGHQTRPANGVLRSYWQCLWAGSPHNRHIKTIVQTKYAIRPVDPHTWLYKTGTTCVNEKRQPIVRAMDQAQSVARVALYHYCLKSRQEYTEKMERGSAMHNHKPSYFFDRIDREAVLGINCTEAWDLGYVAPDSDLDAMQERARILQVPIFEAEAQVQ